MNILWEQVPIDQTDELGWAQIYVVLADGRIPMMAQWRPPGEWWTLGMSQATKIEKGLTHFLRPLKGGIEVT